MTTKKITIKKNTYYDSVYLMGIFEKIKERDAIKSYQVLMATDENKDILELSGFDTGDATADDLVIAIESDSDKEAEALLNDIEDYLNAPQKSEDKTYSNLDTALKDNPDSNLAVISVPGKYAADEAEKALNKGLNVFIFSDNVKAEDEARIKKLGIEKNLLVMGPDAGVGSINGMALATGSKLKTGPIGIVAASGSGAQEVACLIDRYGPGTSQLIGTGGKDLSADIGGLSMSYSMDLLKGDPQTEVIVLVSKLADKDVMAEILSKADTIEKPVVAIFLGSGPSLYKDFPHITATYTLADAAASAIEALKGKKPEKISQAEKDLDRIAQKEALKYKESQKYIRGLFMGGTFTEEALIILKENTNTSLYSNITSAFSLPISEDTQGNILLDMGAEEFTLGRPHPVIDPVPRTEKFESEAKKDDVAVIILDFILSYGVHPDPAGAITRQIEQYMKKAEEESRHLTVIASVCGTEADPQKRSSQVQKLIQAGAIVTESNAHAALLARKILKYINRG